MRVQSRWFVLIALVALVALTGTGCPKKGVVDDVPSAPADEVGDRDAEARDADEPTRVEVRDNDDFPSEEEPSREVLPDPRSAAEYNRLGVLRTIFFAYDSSELTPDARATMRENATWLEAHPELDVIVEGHCDERGTIEYNLSLGQRRARSVRDYLVTLGVGRERIRTVSYGEERPVNRGHDESAWSQNRRAAFTLEDR